MTICASASEAEPVRFARGCPSVPFATAGAVTTGFRLTFAITMEVVAELVAGDAWSSVATQFMKYDPAWLKFGVPEAVRFGAEDGGADELGPPRNGALVVRLIVTRSLSGSVAEAVTLTGEFSEALIGELGVTLRSGAVFARAGCIKTTEGGSTESKNTETGNGEGGARVAPEFTCTKTSMGRGGGGEP